jgi:Ca2+-binding EF-hand superfamily protein
MTYKVSPASSKAAIEKIFPLYDDEDTGFISVQNLQRVAADLGIEVPEA